MTAESYSSFQSRISLPLANPLEKQIQRDFFFHIQGPRRPVNLNLKVRINRKIGWEKLRIVTQPRPSSLFCSSRGFEGHTSKMKTTNESTEDLGVGDFLYLKHPELSILCRLTQDIQSSLWQKTSLLRGFSHWTVVSIINALPETDH